MSDFDVDWSFRVEDGSCFVRAELESFANVDDCHPNDAVLYYCMNIAVVRDCRISVLEFWNADYFVVVVVVVVVDDDALTIEQESVFGKVKYVDAQSVGWHVKLPGDDGCAVDSASPQVLWIFWWWCLILFVDDDNKNLGMISARNNKGDESDEMIVLHYYKALGVHVWYKDESYWHVEGRHCENDVGGVLERKIFGMEV